MGANEDRHVIVELTEGQYSALLDIFRRAKVTVDEAPLAAEVLDALVRGARVSLVAQDESGHSTPLGPWHPLSDLRDIVRIGDNPDRTEIGAASSPTITTTNDKYQTMGAHNA